MTVPEELIYNKDEIRLIENELKQLKNKPQECDDESFYVLKDWVIERYHVTKKNFFSKPRMVDGYYIKELKFTTSDSEESVTVKTPHYMCSVYGIEIMKKRRFRFKLLESALNQINYTITKQ